MIPEAREVRLRRNDRKVLEARCRSPVTLQRDLKRARIVLLAADGRSTRSIAKEVGVHPRIVSLWRHRYAEQGLEGLEDKPRPGKKPIYTKATDKRILGLLDKPPPEGFARWTGPLLAQALGDVDVQYVWRFLRRHKIDLASPGARATIRTLRRKQPTLSASTSPRPRRPLCFALTKSPRSRRWSVRKAISSCPTGVP
jgi:transposase